MVDRCPACQGKLTWFRPGLDRCRCGHRLEAEEASSFPQHTIDLLQVIYDTLHGLPTNPTPASGIPANDLQRMGIDDLLRLLAKIGNATTQSQPQGEHATYDHDRLVRVSAIFEDWPSQFHRFLRSIDPNPDQATIGLARRFGRFYSEIVAAKWIAKEKMVFFRTAFGQYGTYDGATPGADPRFFLTPTKWKALRKQGLSPTQMRQQFEEASVPSAVVNRTELAQRLGVRPMTAQRWVQQGIFGLERHGTLAGGQTVYKTPASLPRKIAVGTMDVREAAKYLGIPVSVLARLRRDGYYRVGHVGAYLAQFSQPDLDTLRTDILACAPQMLPIAPEGHVTLTAFFRMKLHGVENKYKIVRSILDGDLVPAGRVGAKVGDLVIPGESIKAFRDDINVHDVIPASRAAKALECDQGVCAALVAKGKLQGTYRGRNLYVTTTSIEFFRKQYVSCISIAKRLGWGIRRMLRELSGQGIELLRVQRTYPSISAEQSFCPREQAERILFASPSGPRLDPGESSRLPTNMRIKNRMAGSSRSHNISSLRVRID
jgi:hypothetical protein